MEAEIEAKDVDAQAEFVFKFDFKVVSLQFLVLNVVSDVDVCNLKVIVSCNKWHLPWPLCF